MFIRTVDKTVVNLSNIVYFSVVCLPEWEHNSNGNFVLIATTVLNEDMPVAYYKTEEEAHLEAQQYLSIK